MILVFVVLFALISCNKDDQTAKDIYNRWKIVDFMSVESAVYPKNNDYNPIIQFYREGNYTLELDINSCSGSFNLSSGNSIEISATGCTYICCDSKFSEKISTMLPQVKSYEMNKNKMKLNIEGWGWINLELND